LSATIDARQGRPDRATDGYREAIRLASEAGDAEGVRYWHGASALLSGGLAAETAKGV
jgi:hypothetical protein